MHLKRRNPNAKRKPQNQGQNTKLQRVRTTVALILTTVAQKKATMAQMWSRSQIQILNPNQYFLTISYPTIELWL